MGVDIGIHHQQVSGLETAQFVEDMLNELAGLSERAGFKQSSQLLKAVLPVIELEAKQNQSQSG